MIRTMGDQPASRPPMPPPHERLGDATMAARKRAAARRALEEVRDGMIVGLGSGSTAELFVVELGERVGEGLRVLGVPTSERVAGVARAVGIPLTTLDEHPRLALTVDGADEVEPRTLSALKGRGGALLREKLVASATDREIVVVDDSKLVRTLGERQPVPVAVVPFGWQATARRLERLGCRAELRRDGEDRAAPRVSDDGLYILDCHFGPIPEPHRLAQEIKSLVGVVEHGLFIGLVDQVLVAGDDGVAVLDAGSAGR